MSTVRIQLRRGLAAQWTSVNPVLAGGEAGFESDTLKIKIGDGTSHWNSLGYATVTPQNLTDAIAGVVAGEIAEYATLTELSDAIAQEVSDRNDAIATAVSAVVSAEDFIGLSEKGAANGVAELDSQGHVPDSQIPSGIARDSEVSSAIATEVSNRNAAILSSADSTLQSAETYTNTKVSDLIGGAPGILNTLSEIAAALGNDENLAADLASSITTAKQDAEAYTDGVISAEITNRNSAILIAKNAAISTAEGYTDTEIATSYTYIDSAIATEATNRNTAIDTEASNRATAVTNAIATAEGYTNSSLATEVTDRNSAIATAKTEAINSSNLYTNSSLATEVTDRNSAIATAKTEAINSSNLYTDSSLATEVTNRNTAIGVETSNRQTAVSSAISVAEGYTDSAIATEATNRNTAIDTEASNRATAVTNAIATAEGYTDTELSSAISTEVTNRNSAILTAKNAAISTSETYADLVSGNALTNAETYADTKKSEAITAAEAFATSADSTLHTTITGEIATAKSQAISSAGTYTDNAITNLVNGAPSTLDTLAEIATALGSDANLSTTLTNSIALKAPIASPTFTGTVSGITKSMVGLGSVDNTSDSAKPVSTAQQTALDLKANLASPTFTGTVVLPAGTITSGMILDGTIVDADINASAAIAQSKISGLSTSLGLKADLASPTFTGTVSGITKSMVGLGSVDNTSDTAKPISTATQTALDAKLASTTAASTYAPIASPTFTGTVSGVTKAHVGLGNVDNTSDANKPVSTATQTALDAKLALAGGTMTGALTLSGAPTSDLHAATKLYVDGVSAGINFHKSVRIATTSNWSAVYANGTNGFGATLTASANQSINPADGVTLSVGDRILVKSQTDAKQNGIYDVTNIGGASSKWVLTRSADADNNPAGEVAGGDFTFVTEGSTNANTGFILSSPSGAAVLGTDNINYTQFNAAQAIVAGTGLAKSGGTLSIDTATTVDLSTTQTMSNKTFVAPVLGSATATSINGTTIPSSKTLVTTADTGTVTSTMILDGTIVDADINASAAIATSKISGLDTALAAKLSSATAASTYAPIASPTFTGTVSGVTKSMVGLGSVDNTADTAKPISTATQTALDAKLASATAATTYETITNVALKAPLASPTFTGTVTLPTGTITSGMILDGTIVDADINASAAIAQSKISGLSTSLGLKADLASPTFTGTVNAAAVSTTGNVIVGGNLTVNGTTTTINSTTLNTTEQVLVISNTATPTDVTANGAGITIKGATDKTIKWYSSTGAITLSENIDLASGKTYKINGTDVLTATAVGGRTIPASNIVGLTDTQTLTNKTLTSPSISNAAMSGTSTYASGGLIQFSDGTQQSTAGVASLTTIGTAIAASNGTYYPSQYRDQMVPISGTYALTIAPDGTNTAAIGTSVDFYQSAGTGGSFVAGAGVTILSTPGLKLRTTGSVATIMKTAANTWLLFGDLSA